MSWRRVVIGNAFSINMLRNSATVRFDRADIDTVKNIIKHSNELYSIIGHESTAKLASKLLGINIGYNRTFYTLDKDDLLIVIQLKTRLPEGVVLTDEELEDMLNKNLIEFWLVYIL